MIAKIKDNLGLIVLALLSVKLLIGLTIAESVCALALLAYILADRVVSVLYPRQPDLHKEMDTIRAQINGLVSKNEELERSVSALQMEKLRR